MSQQIDPIIILEANPPSPIFEDKPAHAQWFVLALTQLNPQLKLHIFNIVNDEFPKNLNDISGIIITGSSKEVYDSDYWIDKTSKLLKEARQKNIPMLGVCFGHQLIAQTFGGTVSQNSKGREIGTCNITVVAGTTDEILKGIPAEFKAQESHKSTVVNLPLGAQLLAQNKFGIQAFRISDEPVWGVQFHPEVKPETLKRVIEFRSAILKEEGLNPEKIKDTIREAPYSEIILSNFLNIIYAHHKS